MSPIVVSLVGVAIIITITHYLLYTRKKSSTYSGELPPGSMGLPFLGETRQYFTPYSSFDIPPFVKQRVLRYGSIFKTSLVGTPLIISADAELNHIIFQQEGQAFESWYPTTFTQIFGPENLSTLKDIMYKYLKNMVLSLFGPESLKKMIYEVEDEVLTHLNQWCDVDTVELKDATAKMIFNLTAKKLISHDAESSSENLRKNFDDFIKGLISFPLNIPGTAYHKCLQGRKKAMKMLRKLLQERKMKPRKNNEDFFDYVLEELSKEGTLLTEGIALDLMFVLLFASFETTSTTLTLAIKFLTDNPLVLQKLTEEHEMILKTRENASDTGLSWKDYKSMTYTFMVINETLRLANIAPVISRKAIKDVSFKGYTIPAGWPVMVCPPAVHLDPSIYENPLEFNPSRWEGREVHGATKHFMAFGGGMRFCIGADFSKVQMAVFLHHLVTEYKWKAIKGGITIRSPGLQFPDGFHASFSAKSSSKN
ncbi:cytochrome P450 87A3-like [Chenopodium quinoa]|uniref:cytochrome P450 87A3-like n=1 Tax=Chenopodium quinoa TaxID=63459 RepID=UPI000B78074D|nr:cytochrome P450 87A3-like [Chenopodium quinoa]